MVWVAPVSVWNLDPLDLFSPTESLLHTLDGVDFLGQFNAKLRTSPKTLEFTNTSSKSMQTLWISSANVDCGISTAINQYQSRRTDGLKSQLPKWIWAMGQSWRLGTTQGFVFSFQRQLRPYTHESHQIQVLTKLECLTRSCWGSQELFTKFDFTGSRIKTSGWKKKQFTYLKHWGFRLIPLTALVPIISIHVLVTQLKSRKHQPDTSSRYSEHEMQNLQPDPQLGSPPCLQ